jgi:mRNA interferase HicA
VVIKLDYSISATASELRRKLAKMGCTFRLGAKHLIVMYQGIETEMPRHPAREIKTGTYHGILRRLGIKEK